MASKEYYPSPLPNTIDITVLREWLRREFQAIYQDVSNKVQIRTEPKLPLQPEDGMMRYFEDDAFFAGSQQGYFVFRGGYWHRFYLSVRYAHDQDNPPTPTLPVQDEVSVGP